MARGMPKNKVVVAIARELSSFMWDIARQIAAEQEAEKAKAGVA